MSTIRLKLYREAWRRLLGPLVDRRRINPSSELRPFDELSFSSPTGSGSRVWFHAASVGELESLIPIIEDEAFAASEILVTIFSRSAEKPLLRFLNEQKSKRAKAIEGAYSPSEGLWAQAISRLRPSSIVTTKYEAWPELWAAAAEGHVPITLVAARMRPAYRIAQRALQAFGAPLPRLRFFTVEASDEDELRSEFPGSEVRALGDPRWDRVFARLEKSSARARELVGQARGFPRPWWIWAQVWPEDLEQLAPVADAFEGTIWTFPHELGNAELKAQWDVGSDVRTHLNSLESKAWSPPEHSKPGPEIWVHEMGFLSEFYAAADFVYVGGGFGAGLHSTIEPAVQGVPICGGEARVDRFPEVAILERSGQFTRVKDSQAIAEWLARHRDQAGQTRERWIVEARGRRGAAHAIAEAILPS